MGFAPVPPRTVASEGLVSAGTLPVTPARARTHPCTTLAHMVPSGGQDAGPGVCRASNRQWPGARWSLARWLLHPLPCTALSKAAAAADSVTSREPPGEEAGCPEPRFHGQEFSPGLAPPWSSEKTCTERLRRRGTMTAASQLKPAAHPEPQQSACRKASAAQSATSGINRITQKQDSE